MKYALLLESFSRRRQIQALLLSSLLMIHGHALAAMEFFSIADSATIMYDAPSLKAGKVFVASRYHPVEVIVKVEGWVKVRDSGGGLAWVEEKALSSMRYVIVTATQAGAYQSTDTGSTLIFEALQNVVMEWLEPAMNGWVKVRHRDGQVGYVRTHQVWGS
ncbi:MAG: SH3 domain-containing protein [Nitrosomonadaceae bacterium]|nr:SH3 domain-containing protein [Nitrosomonadaceae bacterium]